MIHVYLPLWAMKLLGIPLFAFSILVAIVGTPPNSPEQHQVDEDEWLANGFRWLLWPLFISWFLWIFIRGLVN